MTGLAVEEIGEQLAGSKSRTAINRRAEMLWAFANEIAEGDAIILPDRARRQVVIGRVTGPYEWVESAPVSEDRHTRTVKWSARFGWDDLPEPVKHTVLHYQRPVLRLQDQQSASQLADSVEDCGLSAVYAPPTDVLRDPRSIFGLNAPVGTNVFARLASLFGHFPSSVRTPTSVGCANEAARPRAPSVDEYRADPHCTGAVADPRCRTCSPDERPCERNTKRNGCTGAGDVTGICPRSVKKEGVVQSRRRSRSRPGPGRSGRSTRRRRPCAHSDAGRSTTLVVGGDGSLTKLTAGRARPSSSWVDTPEAVHAGGRNAGEGYAVAC